MLKPATSLRPASPLSPLLSSPPQHFASLQLVIIVALSHGEKIYIEPMAAKAKSNQTAAFAGEVYLIAYHHKPI